MQQLFAVTGATGFLGRAIVRELHRRGKKVRALVRRLDPELNSLEIEQVVGDITDPVPVSQLVAGAHCVFHTAAIAGIWGPWQAYFGINTAGTENVIEQCQLQHVAKLVFTSSPSVTFTGADQILVNESAPYAATWLCHYPHSKALAEQLVLAAHRKDNLATCALRPHLIWGPGDRHLIPRLLARAQAKRLMRIGDGRNLIDIVHIDNAVHSHLQAAESLTVDSPQGGKAYFISQGLPVNCWEWISEILAYHQLALPKRGIPFSVAWYLGHVLERVHETFKLSAEPRMTRFLAAQLARSHYFDISAAKRDFGYSPIKSTEEGMRELEFS